MREARVPVLDGAGVHRGSVVVTLLPDASESLPPFPLVDCSSDPNADLTLPPIQLLEGHEYRYTFDLPIPAGTAVLTDRQEVFERDTTAGNTGRLRPGLYTGTLTVAVRAAGNELGRVAFEVRSRKLEYLKDFRWMLRDIADESAEVIMERFAPAEQRFAIDEAADAATLYQRFAFLRSLLTDDSLDSAIRQVLSRPYVTWEEKGETRRMDQGIRGSSAVARGLAQGGERISRPSWLRLPIESIPRQIVSMRTDTSVDNVPNRFVRFALTRWRDVLVVIKEALEDSGAGFAVTRGLDEIAVVLEHIQGLLGEELFREVGPLTAFPAGNQVLQRREGYRDVLRAYLQFELAAKLAWQGGEDVYRAGQRDVAALYEYWTFMQLARVVADLCGGTFDLANLIEVDQSGLGLSLRRGRTTIVKGVTSRLGRKLSLELWFNREFAGRRESWSLRMRPDCSLEIRPIEGDQGGTFDPVWLHFDAKYRITFVDVDAMNQIPGEDASEDRVGHAKREDLLKMHAYRDAIRRSAGAYVLYPGLRNDVAPFEEYHELLPGLGAFALRPVDSGDPIGVSALTKFLTDVLDHVATQVTQHERGRFWVKTVYDERARVSRPVMWASFLPRPPADTWVALSELWNPRVLSWIEEHLRFPVCVDGTGGPLLDPRSLTADLILLHGPGVPKTRLFLVQPESKLYSATRLREAGYPEVVGQFYYCLGLEEVDLGPWQSHLTHRVVVEAIRRSHPEAPPASLVALTWLDLILHAT
jgi:hypothetical protein